MHNFPIIRTCFVPVHPLGENDSDDDDDPTMPVVRDDLYRRRTTLPLGWDHVRLDPLEIQFSELSSIAPDALFIRQFVDVTIRGDAVNEVRCSALRLLHAWAFSQDLDRNLVLTINNLTLLTYFKMSNMWGMLPDNRLGRLRTFELHIQAMDNEVIMYLKSNIWTRFVNRGTKMKIILDDLDVTLDTIRWILHLLTPLANSMLYSLDIHIQLKCAGDFWHTHAKDHVYTLLETVCTWNRYSTGTLPIHIILKWRLPKDTTDLQLNAIQEFMGPVIQSFTEVEIECDLPIAHRGIQRIRSEDEQLDLRNQRSRLV